MNETDKAKVTIMGCAVRIDELMQFVKHALRTNDLDEANRELASARTELRIAEAAIDTLTCAGCGKLVGSNVHNVNFDYSHVFLPKKST